jgi:hypothetical protein
MNNSSGKKIDPFLFEKFKKTIKDIGMGKRHLSVPDNYDPCQPQEVISFEKFKVKVKDFDLLGKKDKKRFGSVKKAS